MLNYAKQPIQSYMVYRYLFTKIYYCFVCFALITLSLPYSVLAQSKDVPIRLAVFNVSMEASNYQDDESSITGSELSYHLRTGQSSQIKNIAEIIQGVRPHIIILNEFDYSSQSNQDIESFINNYLGVSQNGNAPIEYPYYFSAPVNTGVDTGLDLNNDSAKTGIKGDAFGFGLFPGHYGMAILSQFPIQNDQVRTFQHFLWKDMPNNLLKTVKNEDGSDYYSQQAQAIFRLSSKSHWDVPISVNGQTIHVLASHPTPPVFDGFEDRNGKRNHDEIRFWTDYISKPEQAAYIYDDNGGRGGLSGKHFIIAGDLNSSPNEGDSIKDAIINLLTHSRIQEQRPPQSEGARLHSPDNPFAAQHTAVWRARVDYVLPSSSLTLNDSGVFWPQQDTPLFSLIKDRKSSSDHRLVWIDVDM